MDPMADGIGIDVELTISDDRAEFGSESVVLDDFHAVKPVLPVRAADHDASGVPLTDPLDRLVRRGWDHVIERS
jgi:hypothetical protein